jgi:hypothetical protein
VNFIPFGWVTVSSTLAPNEVEQRLGAIVSAAPKPGLPPWLAFGGQVANRSLSARYLGGVGGLRPIQPVFEGQIVGDGAGSLLRLRVRVHGPGTLLLVVWFTFAGLFLSKAIADGMATGWGPRPHYGRGVGSPLGAAIIGAIFVSGGYAALVVQFWAEVRRGVAANQDALSRHDGADAVQHLRSSPLEHEGR